MDYTFFTKNEQRFCAKHLDEAPQAGWAEASA